MKVVASNVYTPKQFLNPTRTPKIKSDPKIKSKSKVGIEENN